MRGEEPAHRFATRVLDAVDCGVIGRRCVSQAWAWTRSPCSSGWPPARCTAPGPASRARWPTGSGRSGSTRAARPVRPGAGRVQRQRSRALVGLQRRGALATIPDSTRSGHHAMTIGILLVFCTAARMAAGATATMTSTFAPTRSAAKAGWRSRWPCAVRASKAMVFPSVAKSSGREWTPTNGRLVDT